MDNAGLHALHRAQRDAARYATPQRGPDGRYQPVEQLGPSHNDYNNPSFVGGFTPHTQAHGPPLGPYIQSQYEGPPPLPERPRHLVPPHLPPRPPSAPASLEIPPTNDRDRSRISFSSSSSSLLTQMTAVERSMNLRLARMQPFLDIVTGPLLRFDTIESGVWRGAVLIITADAGSYYEPCPTLQYSYDPTIPAPIFRSQYTTSIPMSANDDSSNSSLSASMPGKKNHSRGYGSLDRGRLSRDHLSPTGSLMSRYEDHDWSAYSGKACTGSVPGHEIWVYCGDDGTTSTFWRFLFEIPLGANEMKITYNINNGTAAEFWVPTIDQNMRWAVHSCNGFSAGVNPDDFRGPGHRSGYDPLWTDLLEKHAEEPFHLLMGGGDQLYCDAVTREPELQEWLTLPSPELKKAYALTDEIVIAIDRFFFRHYCSTFRSGSFAKAIGTIPMLNMCDDHDMIDGFGSYPEDLQLSAVFRTIGSRGYFFFLLFQCFINVELDGLDDRPGMHPFHSTIIGSAGPYVHFHSHSILSNVGPQMWTLMLDCRAERRKDQVCSPYEYDKVFGRLRGIPRSVEHLIIQLGIPIAYPRLVFLETALGSKFNPIVYLGRNGSLGLSGVVNQFNDDAELLDDLNDHWTSKSHKKERNWFIQQLQNFGKEQRLRISFVTGDVHCAAVGVFKTLNNNKKNADIPPEQDFRYMVDITTSAIVNTPPPNAVVKMVNTLATKKHKTMHDLDTDEEMIPLFLQEPDGSPAKGKYIMGRRNWCSVRWDQNSRNVLFDIRVEREKGVGQTVGYKFSAPPPNYL